MLIYRIAAPAPMVEAGDVTQLAGQFDLMLLGTLLVMRNLSVRNAF